MRQVVGPVRRGSYQSVELIPYGSHTERGGFCPCLSLLSRRSGGDSTAAAAAAAEVVVLAVPTSGGAGGAICQ